MGFVVARLQCTRFYQPWAVTYDSQQRSIATHGGVVADKVLFRLSPNAANRDPALGVVSVTRFGFPRTGCSTPPTATAPA